MKDGLWEKMTENKGIQNLFVWICTFALLTSIVNVGNRILLAILIICLIAPPIYINNLVVIPFYRKQKTLFFCLLILNWVFFTAFTILVVHTITQTEFKWASVPNAMGAMALSLTVGLAIKMARDGIAQRKERKEAELKLLKAQLDPHFLFNTLNNLYGLSVAQSEKLPPLMLKLSHLLRYNLYETKGDQVGLEKEIAYLENYISLERIRLEDQADIQFLVKGDIAGKSIAPILLIVFVENAFKHLATLEGDICQVKVELEAAEGKLNFRCTNTFDDAGDSDIKKSIGEGGIGLKNARKRLDLLYPNRHHLSIDKGDSYYKVQLTLSL